MRDSSKKPHYFLVPGGGWARIYGERIVVDKAARSALDLHKTELGIFQKLYKKPPVIDSRYAGGQVLVLRAKKVRGPMTRDKAGRFARAAA